jgi:hypothetical protein
MTKRERIQVIAAEHGWKVTNYSTELVLQIERGKELLSIGILPNDGGLGPISVGDSGTQASHFLKSGLPGLLATIRKPAA